MQTDPYKEEVQLSPNQGGRIRPKFIVIHHSSGNFEGTLSWILQRKSRVSYHYLINPANGDRVQMVWDTKRAWGAGRSKWGKFNGMNAHAVQIAFDRDTNTRTPADHEIDSCAHKCVYLMEKFGLTSDAILTHEMIAPGRKNDCSKETHKMVLDRVSKLLK